MKKKLYIHIGHPKTGTTSLQEHFYENFYEKKDNLFYFPQKSILEKSREIHNANRADPTVYRPPGLWSKGHHMLPWYRNSLDIYSGLLQEINDNRNKNIILSCENFHHSAFLTSDNFVNFVNDLRKNFDVFFVCYLQERFTHFIKVFYETRGRHMKDMSQVQREFQIFVDELLDGDYMDSLYGLPASNTIIRHYTSQINVIEDFLSIIGHPISPDFHRRNPSKKEITKFLVFRQDQIEEIRSVTLPQIQKLKDKFPSSQEQIQKLYESTINFQQK